MLKGVIALHVSMAHCRNDGASFSTLIYTAWGRINRVGRYLLNSKLLELQVSGSFDSLQPVFEETLESSDSFCIVFGQFLNRARKQCPYLLALPCRAIQLLHIPLE